MEYKGMFYKMHYLVQLEIWINYKLVDTKKHIWTSKELEFQVACYKRDGYKVQLILTAPYTYKMVVTF